MGRFPKPGSSALSDSTSEDSTPLTLLADFGERAPAASFIQTARVFRAEIFAARETSGRSLDNSAMSKKSLMSDTLAKDCDRRVAISCEPFGIVYSTCRTDGFGGSKSTR